MLGIVRFLTLTLLRYNQIIGCANHANICRGVGCARTVKYCSQMLDSFAIQTVFMQLGFSLSK
jgi:hypothetical protein